MSTSVSPSRSSLIRDRAKHRERYRHVVGACINAPSVIIDMIMAYNSRDIILIAGGHTNKSHHQSLVQVYLSDHREVVGDKWYAYSVVSNQQPPQPLQPAGNGDTKHAVARTASTKDCVAVAVKVGQSVRSCSPKRSMVKQTPVRVCATSAYIDHYMMIAGNLLFIIIILIILRL